MSSAAWLMSERVLRLGVNLFVTAWVARYLGPEGYGSLNFILSVVTIATPMAVLGLDHIIVRELVRKPRATEEILASAFWLKVVGTILMWLSIGAIWPFMNFTESESIMVFWSAGGVLFLVFSVFDYHFQALVKGRYTAWAQLCQVLLGSALKVFFVLVEADIHWFAFVYGMEFLIQGILLASIHKYKLGLFFPTSIRVTLMANMLRQSWPLILSGFAAILYIRVDQVMLQMLVGSAETGIYSAAVRIGEAWYFIPIAICNALFPSIIRAKSEGKGFYYNRLHQLYSLLIWIGLAVVGFVFLFGHDIIGIVFGAEYTKSATILQIHIISGIFISMGIASQKWEINENYIVYNSIRTLIGVTANIVLNMLLIPLYHGVGAAFATLISHIIGNYIIPLFYHNARDNFFAMTKSIFYPKFTK